MSKQEIRQRIWDKLEEENLARFPRPVHGRVPNFAGAERGAERLAALPEFTNAKTVKVNPDSPQRRVRELALREGKKLLMPAPRLKSGFILVDPERVKGHERFAASIKGAFSLGRTIGLEEIPRPDLLVVGSVAVSPDGSRIGKGEGYSEIEHGILRELELVDEKVPIFTTVHPVQIVENVPQDPYDVSVDCLITPEKVVRTRGPKNRPRGILWELVSDQMMREMPVLRELKEKREPP